MFNTTLHDLLMGCNETAALAFPNIRSGDFTYNTDGVFISALRALLSSRIKEDESVELHQRTTTAYSIADTVGSGGYIDRNIQRDQVAYYEIGVSSDNRDEFVKTLAAQMEERGFDEITELRDFVLSSSGTTVFFFIRESTRSTIIVSMGANNKRTYHLIPSLISRFVPWFFKDAPLTTEEREIVRSLTERTSDNFVRLIQKFSERFDLESLKIQATLQSFVEEAHKSELNNAQLELRRVEGSIRTNVENYRDLIRQKEAAETRLYGIEHRISNSNSSELVEFFKTHKMIHLISAENKDLTFVVNTQLEYFDVHAFENFISNPDSYMYKGYECDVEFKDPDVRREILEAIFGSDSMLKLKICANYKINIGGYVSASSAYYYPDSSYHYVRNPHINEYSCLGDHKVYIEEFLRSGNMEGALTQCVVSAQSVNVCESASFPYLLEHLFSDTSVFKCIILPDGTECTVSDAYNWLVNNK